MADINDVPLADRKRFASAFAFQNDRNDIDWPAAAAAYDAKVKPESFRTVTQRAMKKASTGTGEVPEADIGRFAICWIFAKNRHDVDWAKAAAAYDNKVKPESFRTVTQRALKKVAFAPDTTKTDTAAQTGKGKRKAPAEKKKAGGRKKAKVEDDVDKANDGDTSEVDQPDEAVDERGSESPTSKSETDRKYAGFSAEDRELLELAGGI